MVPGWRSAASMAYTSGPRSRATQPRTASTRGCGSVTWAGMSSSNVIVSPWRQVRVSAASGPSTPGSAVGTYQRRSGVCRDVALLAVAFCRALNIPARYTAGYLGDIGVPPATYPMDFSAWFEAYLDDRWWTFDARHNTPRIGRVLLATGLDATDVAITTSFGASKLTHFHVVTDEIV